MTIAELPAQDGRMPRPLRIQYEGALYHVMSRGDRREALFLDDKDREGFLQTLGQACRKTGWEVHAFCLMTNHFHLVVETPQPNLSVGMKWLLGTYTQRFNRRHQHWGHLFGGRFKGQIIDERSRGYLLTACNYVHLNPVRAGLIKHVDRLRDFRWSSFSSYLRPKLRPPWLRVDRVLGELGFQSDTAAARREFGRRTEAAVGETTSDEVEALRRGWRIGAEDFCDRLAERLARRCRKDERAKERRPMDAVMAEAMVRQALRAARWRELDLVRKPKGHPLKVKIAQRLRSETPMTREWIANRLKMGSANYVSYLTIVD